MRGFQQFLKFIGEDVGVDLRRGDVGMAEKHLYCAQVGAALQQVCRVGVPQGMRVNARTTSAYSSQSKRAESVNGSRTNLVRLTEPSRQEP